jgi:DNA-binding response OmpR family regulator
VIVEVAVVSYSNTPVVNYVPTLVIHANAAAARNLADQLEHCGFTADTAASGPPAISAVRARYYGSIVFVGDASHSPDLQCIAELRRRVPRTWIIAISSTAPRDTRELFLRYGVDALIATPFSVQDLASRLFAFSLRSRPP